VSQVSNWFGNKRIRYKKNIVKECLTPGFNFRIYPKEVGQQEIHHFILTTVFVEVYIRLGKVKFIPRMCDVSIAIWSRAENCKL
jgi:hypothetical protein